MTTAIAINAIYFLEQYSNQNKRISINKIASSYASHIRNDLNQALSATYPIAALIRTQNGDVSGFTELAAEMLTLYPGIASIQLFPDGILKYIVPIDGNERAIGHNILLDSNRTKEAFIARDSGKLTLAGPFNLIQGGTGAVARLPIYLDTKEGKKFWGFSAVLIRFPDILQPSDLSSLSDSRIGYQLSRINPDTGELQVISTSNTPLDDDAEIFDIPIPNGHWTFRAYPIDGWKDYPVLFFGCVLGLLFVSLATFSSILWVRLRLNYIQLEQKVLQRTNELNNNLGRLAASEEQFRMIFNQTTIGVALADINSGKFIRVNHRLSDMLGYSAEELIKNKTFEDITHPEDLQISSNYIYKILNKQQRKATLEKRYFHKDGHIVWAELSIALTSKTDDKSSLFIVVVQDITNRKTHEEQMTITGQLLNESQKVGKLGGWKLDVKTGDLFWTDETYRIHETSPEEFNPTVDAGVGFYLPDSRAIISKALDEAINNGVGYDLELETYTTKGRKIDVRTTCHVTLEEGIAIRLTGIFQDISVQKANQRKLEKINFDLANANADLKLAASVFTHAGEGIVITDAKAKIIDVNETFTTTTGYSREEAIGQNPSFLQSGLEPP